MPTIAALRTDLYSLPLPTPVEASAAGLMKGFDMVVARITDTDGAAGCGFPKKHTSFTIRSGQATPVGRKSSTNDVSLLLA